MMAAMSGPSSAIINQVAARGDQNRAMWPEVSVPPGAGFMLDSSPRGPNGRLGGINGNNYDNPAGTREGNP